MRTQNNYILHNTDQVVQQEMYNKKCLQFRNQKWDVLDTTTPVVQKVQPQIQKKIENILFNVSATSKPKLN